MQLKGIYLLLILVFSTYFFSVGNAQYTNRVELEIENAPSGKFLLKQIKGQDQIPKGEAVINGNKLVFTGSFKPGLYGIIKGGIGITFIVNEALVSLQTDWRNTANVFEVINSEENQYWIGYMKKREEIFDKLNLLHPITIRYDRNSPFYEAAKQEFYEVQQELQIYLKSVPESTLAYQFIKADLRPALAHDRSFGEQRKDFQEKWFDGFNWSEDRLLNSDIVVNKVDGFMGLFADRNLSPEQQENEFKRGIDMILSQTQENSKMHEFVLSYLVRKLEQFGMENVILHIAENYADSGDKCEKESSDSEIINRLKKYEQMRIGQFAPLISSFDGKGQNIEVLDQLSEKNLVIFWSSQCTHCRQMIPDLNKWYETAKKSGWTLISISLDKDQQELAAAIKDLGINYPVYSDFKGWNSAAALDYNVSATPAMFVLDKERRIIGKPNWISELKEFEKVN